MFIIAPLIIIGLSIIVVAAIVHRKMPYLRKLSPDAHVAGDNLFKDFFPELVQWYRSINLREYRQGGLRETEKLLRRMRLVLLKIDNVSDRLIKQVRRTHLATDLKHAPEASEPVIQEPAVVVTPAEDLKAKEQQLIIEIAQDPKNPVLYETLGDIYMKMESTPDAIEAYEAALGFDPDNQIVARKYSALLKKPEGVN